MRPVRKMGAVKKTASRKGLLKGGGNPKRYPWSDLMVEFFTSTLDSTTFRKHQGIPSRTWLDNTKGWVQKRKVSRRRIAEVAIEKYERNEGKRWARVLLISSKIQDQIARVLKVRENSKGEAHLPMDAAAISSLTAALKRLVETDFLIRGEPTSRVGIVFEGGTFGRVIEILSAIVKRIIPECCPSCKASLGIRPALVKGLIDASKGFDPDEEESGNET